MSRLCLILFGAPGSGKGTQAKLLRQALALPHISTGDMLRERVRHGDELGLQVSRILQSGGLVPDETVNKLVEERINQPDCAKGFILDGYPRTVAQAKLLTRLLEPLGMSVALVYLKVAYNVIIARIAGRRQCPACGALYGLSANAATPPEVCGHDGWQLVIRDDDREEVVKERLKAYNHQTAPVLEYLRKAGVACWDVDGAARGGPQGVAGRIRSLIEGQLRPLSGGVG